MFNKCYRNFYNMKIKMKKKKKIKNEEEWSSCFELSYKRKNINHKHISTHWLSDDDYLPSR